MSERGTIEHVEAHLRALVDTARDGIVSADGSGRIIQWNPAAEKLFGYSTKEALGKPLALLMPEHFREGHRRGFSRLLSMGQACVAGNTLELVGLRKGGTEFPIEMSLGAWRAEDEGFFTAIIRDVTDRKRIEEERKQFFTASLDLLAIANLDGYFKHLSPSWEEALGWTIPELLARPWLEFVHPEDRAATVAAADWLAQGAPVLEFENRYQCRDGSYRWLSWRVPAPAKNSATLYAAARDVTETKRQHTEIRRLNSELSKKIEEAVAANRDLEAFSYSVSHDLRAPLRTIDGFSEILLEDHAERLDDEGKRILKTIIAGAKKLGDLIDELLEFARTGRAPIKGTILDMTSLAEGIFRELHEEAPGRRIEWKLGDLPPVWADPALLRQVLVNLLGNAIKYTRPKDPATIEMGGISSRSECTYWVKDNGVGFDSRHSHRLFGVFQRLHSSEEFEGTGVGLALVKRVIERHGGRISAEGKEGLGATFTFTLPRRRGDPEPSEHGTPGLLRPRPVPGGGP